MAHPKRRHSKARRDKRRTHHKVLTPQVNKCPECGASKLSHRICLSCGYYKGEKFLDIRKKEDKKKKKQK